MWKLRNSNSAGGIDIQLLGLGRNGHIGFNEPTGSLRSRTWIKILSEQTLRDNSAVFGSFESMPKHAITMGIGTILDARRCLLLAFGPATWPHMIARAMLAEQLWRACSILANHPYHREG